MMILIINNTKLAWSYSVNRGLGMDDVSIRGDLFHFGGIILWGMTNFKRNISTLYWDSEPVEVVDGEVGLVGGGGVVAMGDVEDVVGDIFFDDEPGASGEAHAFALTNGVEPEAFVLTNATTRL